MNRRKPLCREKVTEKKNWHSQRRLKKKKEETEQKKKKIAG